MDIHFENFLEGDRDLHIRNSNDVVTACITKDNRLELSLVNGAYKQTQPFQTRELAEKGLEKIVSCL